MKKLQMLCTVIFAVFILSSCSAGKVSEKDDTTSAAVQNTSGQENGKEDAEMQEQKLLGGMSPAYETLIEKRPDIPELGYIDGSPHSIIKKYNEWKKTQ